MDEREARGQQNVPALSELGADIGRICLAHFEYAAERLPYDPEGREYSHDEGYGARDENEKPTVEYLVHVVNGLRYVVSSSSCVCECVFVFSSCS